MPKYKESASHTGPVGANMFHIRRKLGITQKQLAAPEFSISYISAIERGRIRPSLKALDILARRLGVTSAELLAELYDDVPSEDNYVMGSAGLPSDLLKELLSQRPAPYFAALTICWAGIYLAQADIKFASELLHMLSPGAITAEQRLLRVYFQASISLLQGHTAEAQTMLEDVFRQGEFSSHLELLERCRFLLARTYERQEKYLLASETFSLCVQAIEKGLVSDPIFAIQVYSFFADHYRHLDQREVAAQYYQQVLKFYNFVLNPAAMAEISASIGQKHLANVHSTLADWYAARSRVLLEYDWARQRFTQVASNLGLTFQELGDTQAAEQQLRQTIDYSEKLETGRQGVLARIALADLLLERQEIPEAKRLALEAQMLCRPDGQDAGERVPGGSESTATSRFPQAPAVGDITDEALYGRVLITLGDIHKTLNRLDEAEQCFQEAIELLKKYNASDHLSQAYFHYSDLLHQKGQDAESYEMVRRAFLLTQRNPQAGG